MREDRSGLLLIGLGGDESRRGLEASFPDLMLRYTTLMFLLDL